MGGEVCFLGKGAAGPVSRTDEVFEFGHSGGSSCMECGLEAGWKLDCGEVQFGIWSGCLFGCVGVCAEYHCRV
jgi:hypothetical protein